MRAEFTDVEIGPRPPSQMLVLSPVALDDAPRQANSVEITPNDLSAVHVKSFAALSGRGAMSIKRQLVVYGRQPVNTFVPKFSGCVATTRDTSNSPRHPHNEVDTSLG
jgi:hypothetical protein